jgi:hypothetical protein
MFPREFRARFLRGYGRTCNCAMCALPDRQSTALDEKIGSFHESSTTLADFLLGRENNFLRAAKALETKMAVITETKLHCYIALFQMLDFFTYMGDLELLKVVGRAFMNLCEKYLGTASGSNQSEGIGTTIVAYYIDNPKKSRFWRSSEARACSAAQKSLMKKRLQGLADSIVKSLESL